MPVLPARSLQDTALFTRLKQLEAEGNCPPGLSGNVLTICGEAADRLKFFPAIHGQFTLHDETHCLRVVQLMAHVADGLLTQLNAIEIALLILSAYFHDQGMVVEAAELNATRSSDAWKVHEQNWSSDHPNYEEAVAKLSEPLLVPEERERTLTMINDLRAAMFTDFIRNIHGDRSAQFLQAKYEKDPRLVLNSRSIVGLLAQICASHVRPAEVITPAKGYRFDELIGTTKVNVALLAHILRLADILDFDRERTPESLYRAIHFTSSVSILEWEKHRSVTGWEIAPDRIVFAAECDHPAYERAIREFFNWIDDELSAIQSWGRLLPAEFQRYRLELPQKVDRSRVSASIDPVNRQPAYQYFDLEFSLSRNEIVKLLMTDRLYSNKSLFIRELLQNALDALRHRKALYQADAVTLSNLGVQFEHFQESGFDIVRCHDNGVGMDEDIITRFLTRVGRSYYRSPEFERQRARFKEKGCDFDPCARFGIGFMSCFMFGDEITIRTRRDHGMGEEHGRPLIVEIKGLSGIVVIRPGAADQQVGTTVEVRGRRKSFTVDEWSDPVNLLEVLEGYALAAEFTISGDCRVPAIKGHAEIAPLTTARPHPMEAIDVLAKTVFTADLAMTDQRLRGEIRVCTLTDGSGNPVVANEEGTLKIRRGPSPQSLAERIIVLKDGREIKIETEHGSNQVCCDGILVAGHPGRVERPMRLGHYSCHYGFGSATFMIDARGDLKPNLTPARTPPESSFDNDPTWERLFDVAGHAYSGLLDLILERCAKSGEPDRFWSVIEGYGLDPYYLRLINVWRHLSFPMATAAGVIEWLAVRDLEHLRLTFPVAESQAPTLTAKNGKTLKIPTTISDFQGQFGLVSGGLSERLITGMSTIVALSPTELELSPEKPNSEVCLSDLVIRAMAEWRWFFRCRGDLARVVCVMGPHGFSNAEHPVVILGRSIHYKPWGERSPLERILGRLVWGNLGERFDMDVPKDSRSARNRKQMGLLYREVDWNSVDASLRPPYRVFRPGVGVEEMTETHLMHWAEAPYVAEARG